MRRCLAASPFFAACLLAALLFASSSASAGVVYTTYWGYNNLSRTNPPAGTCNGQGAAIACSGFNNTPPHDTSFLAHQSGSAYVDIGFQNCIGCALYGQVTDSTPGNYETTYPVVKFFYPNLGPYNRVYCAHYTDMNTYAYAQCRWGRNV